MAVGLCICRCHQLLLHHCLEFNLLLAIEIFVRKIGRLSGDAVFLSGPLTEIDQLAALATEGAIHIAVHPLHQGLAGGAVDLLN